MRSPRGESTPVSGGSSADDELETAFSALAQNYGLPPDVVANLSLDQKRKMVQGLGKEATTESSDDDLRNDIKILHRAHHGLFQKMPDSKEMMRIRIHLSTKPRPWVKSFREMGGVNSLFWILREFVTRRRPETKDSEMIAECLRCIKSILNADNETLDTIIEGDAISLLIKSSKFLNPKTQTEVFDLLAALSFLPKYPYKQIIASMEDVGLRFFVSLLESKYKELHLSTLNLINTLLLASQEGDDEGKKMVSTFCKRLEKNGFLTSCQNLRETVKEDVLDTDPLMVQLRFYDDFLTDESLIKIQILEKALQKSTDRNMKLSQELDAERTKKGTGVDVNQLLQQLKLKDEAILSLEARLKEVEIQKDAEVARQSAPPSAGLASLISSAPPQSPLLLPPLRKKSLNY
eukprot:TRINITY_DN932_c1_g1_i11.p1 TRINITY_DN932_c1_g1~~TRINITY_DN932_c1_g1_i11.p1  ORF type:complete len:434 (-),score=112.75 TRINITY_DN932_c1_g1_i11:1311-2528(-)